MTLLLVLVASLLAPAALAQVGSVVVTPSPAAQEAQPGAKVSFRLQVQNTHILEQNVALVAAPPAGWSFNATPANVTIPAGGSANVTLDVYLPADAPTNATVPIPVEARTYGTELVLGRAGLNVTVVAPPPPQPVVTPPPPTPPNLAINVASASGSPGATVEGLVRLRNHGAETLDVRLFGEAPAGWNPRFREGDQVQVLHPGEPERLVRVYANVPATATPGDMHTLSVVATANGFRFPAGWSITVLPPPPPTPPPEPDQDGGQTSTGDSQPQEIPKIEAEPTVALDARVLEPLLQVAPGETVSGTVRLENTGTTPLKLRLAGRGPTDWRAPVPERATLDLAPGDVTEVRFDLTAPDDVIPSATGRGAGGIVVTSESGLMRTASFPIMVVPGGPLDPAATDTESNAALVAPGGEGGMPLGAWGLAAALGSVGAGAMALANRPLREKLVWGAVGLYTRLARPDVLGHTDREKLYKLVETTPGIHFHALQRDLGWNTGTLTYHLRVLEKHGFVVSRRDGLYRRFYLQGSAPRKEVFENQGPSGLRADVLEAIRNHHGMSQTDLSLALGANKQTVNYHVKALERQGLIRLEKRGRETFLYPAGAGEAVGRDEARA